MTASPPSTDDRVRLVERHSRLPGYWAARYRRLARAYRVEYQDLVQDAELALFQAAASWGPDDGRFSRHATRLIRRTLWATIATARRSASALPLPDGIPQPTPDPGRVLASAVVWDAVAELTVVEQGIVIARYSLGGDGERRSWQQVGLMTGHSHTAAKQIHDQAIPLLRALIARDLA